jgi:hypothetical protein
MNPDTIIICIDCFHNFVSKDFVGSDICLEQGAVKELTFVKANGEHIMEKRPQLLFTEAMVELLL